MAGFAHNRGIERRYAAQLAKVAKEVGKLAARFADDVPGLVRALKEYAAKLEPWAAQVADRFIGEVDKANARAWAEKSQTIAKALKGDVAKSAIGLAAQERHFAQVTLITSLPLEAAARAQKLAEDAARGGKRAGDVREAILETESVTASRAQLIARTEIAKANAALTEARAQMAGITHYIWRTMQDEDVRESHAALEGQIFAFDAPPVVDEGGSYNPGGVYNCFTGDTICRIDADMQHVLRSHYCGTVREIHTAGSRYGAIIVTPNHPMKTATGWKSAADVQAGDTLCAQEGGDGIPFAKLFTDYATCGTWGEGDLYGRRAIVEARTLDPAKLAQHRHGGTKDVKLYVTSITERHFDGDVYTVATRKGWQRVGAGAICQNCRCFAEPILTQPDAPLELIAPGTTLEQRAAEVATAIARSVAARKAAATRAAKKAETVASRAIAAREAKAVAQVEKGAAALRAAAAKAAEQAEKAAVKAVDYTAALKSAGITATQQGERVILTGSTFAHKEAIKKAGGRWDGAAKAWTMKPAQAEKLAAKLAPAPLAPPSAEVVRIMELTGFAREKAEKRAAEMAAERAAKELAKKTATTFTQEAYEATRASLQARGVTLAPAIEGTFSGSTIRRVMGTKHTQVTRWHLYGDTYAHREAIRAAGGKWLPEAQVWEVTTAQAQELAKAM